MRTTFLALSAAQAASSFQVGGYLENWVNYSGYDKFNTVYYAFSTLDDKPNADTPNNKTWDGKAVYETMTLAPILDVITKTDPLWKNPNEWQRVKIERVMNATRAAGKKFIWSIGGWSDLVQTLNDDQIPAFVNQTVSLLQVGGGDGIDLDWEHLSEDNRTDVTKQQRSIVGKTVHAMRAAFNEANLTDKTISYTTRWNCFWSSHNASQYNAEMFDSDGECLDTFSQASPDDVDWVNLMMYDAEPKSAFKGKEYFGMEEYLTVLEAAEKVLPKEKIVMGFEPGNQATKGIWEGFDIDFKVIDHMKAEGYGGIMFWAINEASKKQNDKTPKSSEHTWQGDTGKNAQYIASRVMSSTILV